MRVWELAIALAVVGCRSQEATAPAAAATRPDAVGRDDPAACVGPAEGDTKADGRVREALMTGIAGLGECAAYLEKPSAVLARVEFGADGNADKVVIVRANTANCEAIDCVRRRLDRLEVPPSPEEDRYAGADFVLRQDPPPDGNETVRWEDGTASDRCTDPTPSADELGLTREQAEYPIQERYDRLRACYETGVAREKNLGGRMIVQLTISTHGNVVDVNVSANQLADCEVVACIVTELRTLKFPRPRATFALEFPLNFRLGKDPAEIAPPTQ